MKADRTTVYGKYFLSLLHRNVNTHSRYQLTDKSYPEEITLFISIDAMERFGGKLNIAIENKKIFARLNPAQTMDFNDYISKTVRSLFRSQTAAYLHFDPSLKRAIEFSRQYFNISEDDYSSYAIEKDLQRARGTTLTIPAIYKPKKEDLEK